MRKWLILLSALSGTAVSAAPAWTWVDEEGTRHYSDRPVPGAEQVELLGAQGFGAQHTPRATHDAQASAAGVPGAPYQSIEVVSPAEQETLWNIGTNLPVQVRFQPALQSGHRYDLLLDGQRRNVNTATPRVTLPDVYRGEHTLQVLVIDSAGTEVMRSPARVFFVQQTSTLNPNAARN
ncbi:MAG TPA: DUF4124 domain-containing protein [Gammaproteobacteria bacterium]